MYFFFFYPVGTRPRGERRAPGIVALSVVLVVIFLIRFWDPVLNAELIWSSFRPNSPSVSGAVLSLFLHGGWAHLLGNLLYLVIFGRQLESRIGFWLTLSIFILGGVAGCYLQGWTTPDDAWNRGSPVIGASGAIAAILGATILRFHHTRVRVLYVLFALIGGVTKGGVVYVNTVVAAMAWFAFQVVYGLVAWGNGGASTAYMAHIGGFLAGVVLGIAMGFPRQAKREVHLERGRRYFEAGSWFAAAGEFAEHLRVAGENEEARALRARCFVLLGRTAEATEEYQSAFQLARRRRDISRQAELYREMRRYGIGTSLQPPALMRLAFDLQKAGEFEGAVEAYWQIETSFVGTDRAELAAIRRAEILWDQLGDMDRAKTAYRQMIKQYPDGEWCGLAEARLRSMDALTGDERISRVPTPGTATAVPSPSARPARASSRPPSPRSP
ncbi:rhomboid family intramembrane serine protease [bacterium]|nr:rhomboid family intramembrane serine protease [bacterium]